MKIVQLGRAISQYRIKATLAVSLTGFVVFSSGCGIPCHRCALPGPVMPQFFAWHNGLAEGAETTSTTEIIEPQFVQSDQEVERLGRDSATADGKIKLASFTPTKHEVELNQPADSSRRGQAFVTSSSENNSRISYSQNASQVEQAQATASTIESQPTRGEVAYQANSSSIPVGEFFDDPHLIDLINQALIGNQELRILSEEIRIANNEAYARSGEYRPFVDYGAGAGLEKSSRFTREGAVEDQLEAAPGRGFPDPLPDFIVGTNISWELDIWKKLRNAQYAASMRYLGTQEGRNFVVTQLVAEIADSYYELLALDNRLLTLQQTIAIQQSSFETATEMKEAGRGTELAVQRFQAEVQKNQSELAVIRQEIVEVENKINFLLGRYPQPVARSSGVFFELNLNSLSSGLPSELLQNRADIRRAEREVAAAGLDVQVARARFYPSLGLNAGVGLNAYNMRYLLSTPESLIYNTALDLVGPLINKRAIQADYCTANSVQLQSIYDYQRTVLNAHIEVVNYITKVDNYRKSLEAKQLQLNSLQASVDAANQLFQNARAEYVEVLLAQRELMEARMMLIDIKKQQLGAVVNAYQALGGGAF